MNRWLDRFNSKPLCVHLAPLDQKRRKTGTLLFADNGINHPVGLFWDFISLKLQARKRDEFIPTYPCYLCLCILHFFHFHVEFFGLSTVCSMLGLLAKSTGERLCLWDIAIIIVFVNVCINRNTWRAKSGKGN